MNKLEKRSLAFFVALAFSIYYLFYFYAFEQGATDSIFLLKPLKIISIFLLTLGFFNRDISLNIFDVKFIFLLLVFLILYIVSSFSYGFNDTMFLNFLMFGLSYLILMFKNSLEKIFYTYKILCVVCVCQVLGDIFFRILGIHSLWEGGLFIGGLGNPSSFAFVCNFCFAFTLFVNKNSFSNTQKIFMGILYAVGVLMSGALFMVILLFFILLLSILISKDFLRKIIMLGALFSFLTFMMAIVYFRGGLLAGKMKALLFYFGLNNDYGNSISISIRAANSKLLLDFIESSGSGFFWGNFKDLSYFPLDSQYITIFLSFGYLVFLLFFVFIFISLLKTLFYSFAERDFVLVVMLMFFTVFLNNRILDYFPIGYLFVSLIAIISKSESTLLSIKFLKYKKIKE